LLDARLGEIKEVRIDDLAGSGIGGIECGHGLRLEIGE
jgi:hypothetical protein